MKRVPRHVYTGNRPDAKPENWGNRALPFEEFEELVAVEIAAHNARPDRRSEVAFGRSFDDVFAESYANAPIRKATPEQRRLWLMGAQGVSVGSTNGRISFMGNAYFAEWLHEHLGQKVVARFDDGALWDGSDLPQLLDAPMNGETIVDVFAAVAEALHRWEPRLRLKRVEITSAASGAFELVLEGETVAGAISVNTRMGGSA